MFSVVKEGREHTPGYDFDLNDKLAIGKLTLSTSNDT